MFAASVNFQVELIAFAFVEARQARPFDGTDVHERIGLAIIAGKEAKALHRIEELDRTGRLFAGQLTLRRAATITAAVPTVAAITTAVATRFHGNDIANDLEILSGNLAAAINQIVFELLTFAQPFEAGAFDRADVDEHVLTTTILLDEAEALLTVEEFHGAFASSDDLRGHPVAAAEATAAAATTVTAAEATATIAAAEAATTATKAIAATAETIAAAKVITVAETTRRTAERIETILPEAVALVPSATAPFVVTHNQ